MSITVQVRQGNLEQAMRVLKKKVQKEYMTAFNEVVYLYDVLKEAYDQSGFNEDSEGLLKNYKNSYNLFESEYEI